MVSRTAPQSFPGPCMPCPLAPAVVARARLATIRPPADCVLPNRVADTVNIPIAGQPIPLRAQQGRTRTRETQWVKVGIPALHRVFEPRRPRRRHPLRHARRRGIRTPRHRRASLAW